MKTLYLKFKDKVKYHSVISLPLFGDVCEVYFLVSTSEMKNK
jgi:hypothetical protein